MILSNIIYKAKRYFLKKFSKDNYSDSNIPEKWIEMEHMFFDKEKDHSFRNRKNNIITIGELIYTVFDIDKNQIESILEINSENKTLLIEENPYDYPLFHNNYHSVYHIKIREFHENKEIKDKHSLLSIYIQPVLNNDNGNSYIRSEERRVGKEC